MTAPRWGKSKKIVCHKNEGWYKNKWLNVEVTVYINLSSSVTWQCQSPTAHLNKRIVYNLSVLMYKGWKHFVLYQSMMIITVRVNINLEDKNWGIILYDDFLVLIQTSLKIGCLYILITGKTREFQPKL